MPHPSNNSSSIKPIPMSQQTAARVSHLHNCLNSFRFPTLVSTSSTALSVSIVFPIFSSLTVSLEGYIFYSRSKSLKLSTYDTTKTSYKPLSNLQINATWRQQTSFLAKCFLCLHISSIYGFVHLRPEVMELPRYSHAATCDNFYSSTHAYDFFPFCEEI